MNSAYDAGIRLAATVALIVAFLLALKLGGLL